MTHIRLVDTIREACAELDRRAELIAALEAQLKTALKYHDELVAQMRKARAVAASPLSFDLEGVERDFASLLARIDAEVKS